MIKQLFKDQRPLMITGAVWLVCGLAMLLLSLVDNVQILGINRWIKPMKFFFSLVFFFWTVAIYLNHLKGYRRFSLFVSWAMILIFAGEMAGVVGQAIRGTTSHFNMATMNDGLVFAAMGILISINTFLIVVILILYFWAETDLSSTMLWAMRLGLVLFLAGSIQGGYMSAQMSHSVGSADGGPGLPLTNWSTIAGDLRVAHFLGLHSLQAIPLFGLALERSRISGRTALTFAFAAAYFAMFALLFYQALLGKPLITI